MILCVAPAPISISLVTTRRRREDYPEQEDMSLQPNHEKKVSQQCSAMPLDDYAMVKITIISDNVGHVSTRIVLSFLDDRLRDSFYVINTLPWFRLPVVWLVGTPVSCSHTGH